MHSQRWNPVIVLFKFFQTRFLCNRPKYFQNNFCHFCFLSCCRSWEYDVCCCCWLSFLYALSVSSLSLSWHRPCWCSPSPMYYSLNFRFCLPLHASRLRGMWTRLPPSPQPEIRTFDQINWNVWQLHLSLSLCKCTSKRLCTNSQLLPQKVILANLCPFPLSLSLPEPPFPPSPPPPPPPPPYAVWVHVLARPSHHHHHGVVIEVVIVVVVIVIVIIIVVVVDTVDNIDDELRGKNGTRKHTKDCLRCSCLKMMMTTMAIKIMLMMVLVKVHFIHFKSSFEEILKIPPALYCKTWFLVIFSLTWPLQPPPRPLSFQSWSWKDSPFLHSSLLIKPVTPSCDDILFLWGYSRRRLPFSILPMGTVAFKFDYFPAKTNVLESCLCPGKSLPL